MFDVETPRVLMDPEEVRTLYFRAEPAEEGVDLPPGLGPVEVSVDGGTVWRELTLGVDLKNAPAYLWVVAMPGVDPAHDGVDTRLTARTTECLSRVVDNPEITVKAFTIYATR